VAIGLLDGPVATAHPELAHGQVREIAGGPPGACARPSSAACTHGTFVAGILCAKRGSAAPAICPDCTLLVRPIFAETTPASGPLPTTTPLELASAIVTCINAGARVLNVSAGLAQPSTKAELALDEAVDYAARHGVLVVVAAGNQGTLGSWAVIRHPWVIPVAACDRSGRPSVQSNLGTSIGRRGLLAPGVAITSLGVDGQTLTSGGTSAAVPFVTGAIALLWSAFPDASATEIKAAIAQRQRQRRSVTPPLLDAWAAHQIMAGIPKEERHEQ
jgi:subtilisin family serine protease